MSRVGVSGDGPAAMSGEPTMHKPGLSMSWTSWSRSLTAAKAPHHAVRTLQLLCVQPVSCKLDACTGITTVNSVMQMLGIARRSLSTRSRHVSILLPRWMRSLQQDFWHFWMNMMTFKAFTMPALSQTPLMAMHQSTLAAACVLREEAVITVPVTTSTSHQASHVCSNHDKLF